MRIVHPWAHGHGVPVSYLFTRDAVVRVDEFMRSMVATCFFESVHAVQAFKNSQECYCSLLQIGSFNPRECGGGARWHER